MNRCTAPTRRWPDNPVDVHPDEEEEFLAHAEGCPYHAAALAAEAEQFLSGFRKDYRHARTFGGGRILEREEVASAAASRREQAERWLEAVAALGLQFSHICLYNNHVRFARYSKLFTLNVHDGVHELEPGTEIEIRGVINHQDFKAEAWLGSYDLAANPSGKEEVINFKNGYSMALKVERKGEEKFRVKFKFVETDRLKGETENESRPLTRVAVAGGGTAASQRPPAKRATQPAAPRRGGRPTLPTAVVRTAKYAFCILLMVTLAAHAGVQRIRNSSPGQQPELRRVNDKKREPNVPSKDAPPANESRNNKENKVAASPQTLGKLRRAKALPTEATNEVSSDSSSDALEISGSTLEGVNRIIHDGRRRPSPTPNDNARPPASDVLGAVTRPRYALTLGASLKRPTSAGQDLVIFRVVGQQRVREQFGKNVLEQLRKRIKASGGDVIPQAPTEDTAKASVRDRMNIDLVVEKLEVQRKSYGLRLIFRTEVDGKSTVLRQAKGEGETVADASKDALNEALPHVFTEIDKLLAQSLPPSTNAGGGGDSFNDKNAYMSRLLEMRGGTCTLELTGRNDGEGR